MAAIDPAVQLYSPSCSSGALIGKGLVEAVELWTGAVAGVATRLDSAMSVPQASQNAFSCGLLTPQDGHTESNAIERPQLPQNCELGLFA